MPAHRRSAAAVLAVAAVCLGALVFAGCGGDDGGDEEQAVTSASDELAAEELGRLFEMYDEFCTPDTGSKECSAFMWEYCGKLDPSEDKAPEEFCLEAEFRIFGAEGPPGAKEPGEGTEEPEATTPPEPAGGTEQGRAIKVGIQILPGDELTPVVTVDLGPRNVVAVYDEKRFRPNDFRGAPQVTIRRGGPTGWQLVSIVD